MKATGATATMPTATTITTTTTTIIDTRATHIHTGQKVKSS